MIPQLNDFCLFSIMIALTNDYASRAKLTAKAPRQ